MQASVTEDYVSVASGTVWHVVEGVSFLAWTARGSVGFLKEDRALDLGLIASVGRDD